MLGVTGDHSTNIPDIEHLTESCRHRPCHVKLGAGFRDKRVQDQILLIARVDGDLWSVMWRCLSTARRRVSTPRRTSARLSARLKRRYQTAIAATPTIKQRGFATIRVTLL